MTPDTDRGQPKAAAFIAAVALGGAIGAVMRWLVELSTVALLDAEPVATLIVNILGCFAMGVLVARVLGGEIGSPLIRPFLGTGVLGGFTTFSAYAADAAALTRDGAPALAGVYVVGTLAVCLGAVWLGGMVGRVRGAAS